MILVPSKGHVLSCFLFSSFSFLVSKITPTVSSHGKYMLKIQTKELAFLKELYFTNKNWHALGFLEVVLLAFSAALCLFGCGFHGFITEQGRPQLVVS